MRETMHTHEKEAEEYWKAQSPLFEELYRDGIARYAQTSERFYEAFKGDDRCVRCIDEGTPGGIHFAGSGILMGKEKALEALALANAEGVSSHEGCGAAKLYAQRRGLDERDADAYAMEWSRNLASLYGVPYTHIAKERLARPADLHIARAMYYDGTGMFGDPTRAGLPKGFVVSRRFMDISSAQEDAAIGISIALGAHGFGERITEEEPFIIIPIGDPSSEDFSLDRLYKELADLGKERVIIDGFVAPAVYAGE